MEQTAMSTLMSHAADGRSRVRAGDAPYERALYLAQTLVGIAMSSAGLESFDRASNYTSMSTTLKPIVKASLPVRS